MKPANQARPFGIRDKIGYLFGDFGNDFTFILSSSFLLKFYADVMGVPAAIVGVIMMIARFVDAFTDVAMGRLCDRGAVTAAGKFKPWIRRMSIPVAVASFLIYQSGMARYSLPVKVAYLFLTYILWGSVLYTAINIPYGSMASAISDDPDDRQSLSTYRTMGGMLAGVVIGAGVPVLAYDQVEGNMVMNGPRFTVIAGVFSVLAVLCYALCYVLTTERVKPGKRENATRKSVGALFWQAVRNRALISIIVASILMLLAQLTMQSMANFVYPNYYGSATAQSSSTLVMMLGMLIAAAAVRPLSKKFGKAEVSVAANFLAAAVCLALYLIRPANVWVYVAFQGLCWLGLGVFSMVTWALITDVIDHSEVVTGVREDGSVYAMYSFARKLGQAAAAGLSGFLLTMIGYTQETAFEPRVREGIFNIATLLPGVGFLLLALVLWLWYPLKKRKVDENVAVLRSRRQLP